MHTALTNLWKPDVQGCNPCGCSTSCASAFDTATIAYGQSWHISSGFGALFASTSRDTLGR